MTCPTVQLPHGVVSNVLIGQGSLLRQHETPCQQHHPGTTAEKLPLVWVQFLMGSMFTGIGGQGTVQLDPPVRLLKMSRA